MGRITSYDSIVASNLGTTDKFIVETSNGTKTINVSELNNKFGSLLNISGKVSFVDLGESSDFSVFNNNTNYKTIYSVLYNSVEYYFFRIENTIVQYRISGNGIDYRLTSESTWHSLDNKIPKDTEITEGSTKFITSGAVFAAVKEISDNINDLDAMKMGKGHAPTDSQMFNTYTDPAKIYFGTYTDAVHYHFFTIKDFNNNSLKAQFRFSINGVEIRLYDSTNSTWGTWTNITSNKLDTFIDTSTLVTSSMLNASTYWNQKYYYIRLDANVLFSGQAAGLGAHLINVNQTQYILTDGCGVYYRQGSGSSWRNVSSKITVWDYGTSQTNNFTVPTSYAGNLGDIVFVTTGTGTGGKAFMLTKTVSSYGSTSYYWEEININLSSRVTALEDTVGTLNTTLENALNGASS